MQKLYQSQFFASKHALSAATVLATVQLVRLDVKAK